MGSGLNPLPLIRKLPHWVLTDTFTAFYDSESLTARQQVEQLFTDLETLQERVADVEEDVEMFTH